VEDKMGGRRAGPQREGGGERGVRGTCGLFDGGAA